MGDIGSNTDISMTTEAFKFLAINDPELIRNNIVHDYIDINYGRDFLKENGSYDVVILQYVYGPAKLSYGDMAGDLAISEHHSQGRWRERLLESGAKYIIAFGGGTEVAHRFIGELSGYTTTNFPSPGEWVVYERED